MNPQPFAARSGRAKRFVATLPAGAGSLTPSTAGGRELRLAGRPPAPFTSGSGVPPRSGHELAPEQKPAPGPPKSEPRRSH